MHIDRISVPEGVPFVKVTRTIDRPVQEVFGPIVEADLTRIFPDFGGAPGLVATTMARGWNRPGLQRVHTFSDGATVSERLLTVEPNQSFSYRVQDFSSPALQALDHIDGTWLFTDNRNGTTGIEWVYALFPKDAAAGDLIERAMVPAYRQRLEYALDVLKRDAEAAGAPG